MTLTNYFLAAITSLLTVIMTLLSVLGRIYYGVLRDILREVQGHGHSLAALETWRTDHTEEVRVQRQQWRDEADRAWAAIHYRERGNGPAGR